MEKTTIAMCLIIGLMLVGSVVVLYNEPKEIIVEKVCYPAIYSVSNNGVVEIEQSYCEVVNR